MDLYDFALGFEIGVFISGLIVLLILIILP